MFKKLLGHKINQVLFDNKWLLLGVIICVGSVGLLMGGITCTIASLILIKTNLDLTVAMMIGFYAAWLISVLVGACLILIGRK